MPQTDFFTGIRHVLRRSICEKLMADAMFEAPGSRSKVFRLTLDYAKARLEA